jgi:ABC-type phosphate transport system auxiliary subunit
MINHSASTIKLRVDVNGWQNAMSPLIPLESTVSGSVVLVLGVIGFVAVKVENPAHYWTSDLRRKSGPHDKSDGPYGLTAETVSEH